MLDSIKWTAFWILLLVLSHVKKVRGSNEYIVGIVDISLKTAKTSVYEYGFVKVKENESVI